MLICPTCRSENPLEQQVCAQCGADLTSLAPRLVPVDQRPDVPFLVLSKPEMTIGRSHSHDLYLPDPSVSRLHARVRHADGDYVIEDSGSRHGLEVNGQKVVSHRLQANDLVKIGVYRFRFVQAQAAAPEPTTLLQAEVDHLHLLLDVTRVMNSSLALNDVLEHVIDSVIKVTRAERGFLMLVSEAGRLEFKVSRNLDQTALDSGEIAISFSTVDRVRTTGAPVVLTDTLKADALAASGSVVALGLRSVMCAPLKVQERFIGVIYVDSHRQAKSFSQTDLRLFESLASQAAVAIEKSRLYEQLQQYSVSLEDQVRHRTAELAQANDGLRQAYAELRQTQAQMVQAEKLAAIGRLAAGIAHEINSPLGAMTSNFDTLYRAFCRLQERLKEEPRSDELERQLGTQEQVRVFEEIHRNSHTASARMRSIIKALENFVGLDQAERKPVDLNEALESTLTLLEHQMGERIRVVKEYGTLPLLTCSPGRINQMFMNVLLNAIQAIDGEGEVRIRSDKQAEQLRITIEDTGRGMGQDQLAKIFDPVITRKEGRMGAGLGLAMTRQIIQEHHGDIQIESKPLAGTKVTLRLPLDGGLKP